MDQTISISKDRGPSGPPWEHGADVWSAGEFCRSMEATNTWSSWLPPKAPEIMDVMDVMDMDLHFLVATMFDDVILA